MPGKEQDQRLVFYRALFARFAQLLPRLSADRSRWHSMDRRRTWAQFDAILCHVLERLGNAAGEDAQAIAACMPTADWQELQRSVRADREQDPSPLSLRLHHLGLVADRPRAGERHAAAVGMYTADAPQGIPLQWHRYEPSSPLHPLLRAQPHVAYQAAALGPVLQGASVILGPYEPIDGYRVAVINDHGVPVELIETHLSHAEAVGRARSGLGTLYRS